jgi:hypothetical protein
MPVDYISFGAFVLSAGILWGSTYYVKGFRDDPFYYREVIIISLIVFMFFFFRTPSQEGVLGLNPASSF